MQFTPLNGTRKKFKDKITCIVLTNELKILHLNLLLIN